jgi:hypothetical protein
MRRVYEPLAGGVESIETRSLPDAAIESLAAATMVSRVDAGGYTGGRRLAVVVLRAGGVRIE